MQPVEILWEAHETEQSVLPCWRKAMSSLRTWLSFAWSCEHWQQRGQLPAKVSSLFLSSSTTFPESNEHCGQSPKYPPTTSGSLNRLSNSRIKSKALNIVKFCYLALWLCFPRSLKQKWGPMTSIMLVRQGKQSMILTSQCTEQLPGAQNYGSKTPQYGTFLTSF